MKVKTDSERVRLLRARWCSSSWAPASTSHSPVPTSSAGRPTTAPIRERYGAARRRPRRRASATRARRSPPRAGRRRRRPDRRASRSRWTTSSTSATTRSASSATSASRRCGGRRAEHVRDRGGRARASTRASRPSSTSPLPDSACVYCGNCIGVCPTGALMFTSEHDMREAGTWDESQQTVTETICPYCGVGCDLELHVQDNSIVKVTSPLGHTGHERPPLHQGAVRVPVRAEPRAAQDPGAAANRRRRTGLPEVAGVVLAGGRSTRFGRDKLSEPYRGTADAAARRAASGRGVFGGDRRPGPRRARTADADRAPRRDSRATRPRARVRSPAVHAGLARRRDRVRPGHRRRHAGPADPGPARDAAGGGGGRRRGRWRCRTARVPAAAERRSDREGGRVAHARSCTTAGGRSGTCSTRCGSP